VFPGERERGLVTLHERNSHWHFWSVSENHWSILGRAWILSFLEEDKKEHSIHITCNINISAVERRNNLAKRF